MSSIVKGYKQLLAEANAVVKEVPVSRAADLTGSSDVVFVDLRDPREIARDGRIPGAFHCPRGMLEFWIDPESPYAKDIFARDVDFIFYCASGWRSALSAKTAQEMGLDRVSHLGGGFKAWRESGAPIDTDTNKSSS